MTLQEILEAIPTLQTGISFGIGFFIGGSMELISQGYSRNSVKKLGKLQRSANYISSKILSGVTGPLIGVGYTKSGTLETLKTDAIAAVFGEMTGKKTVKWIYNTFNQSKVLNSSATSQYYE